MRSPSPPSPTHWKPSAFALPEAAATDSGAPPPPWLSEPTDGERLAAWTLLDTQVFAVIYTTVAKSAPNAARWATLGTTIPTEAAGANSQALIRAACREAEAKGFLDRLAFAVVDSETSLMRRSAEEGGQLLDAIATSGEMQAVVDAARGFMDVDVLSAAFQAAQACALVYQGNKPIGTAFLVRPDVVVTAAHVVLDIGKDANGKDIWLGTLRPDLMFSFRAAPGDPRARVEVVAAQRAAPLAFARPHGAPPNKLRASLTPPADTDLDYAYVQLAGPITHLNAVDISAPVEPEASENCFVIGFPGGNDLKFDTKQIESVDKAAGRMMHFVNAAPGMSGGCCVGRNGTVIGLHEGALPVLLPDGKQDKNGDGEKLFRNRGVCLAKIRAGQQGNADPLAIRRPTEQVIELSDPALVRTSYRNGLRLAGAELADKWRALVQWILGLPDLPGDGTTFPAFHPWFKRGDLERWTDSRKPAERLCYVYGEIGAGKSFSVEILRAKLANPTIDLLTINGTQTSAWSWEDAIAPIIPLDAPQFRTEAGAIRYDDVPALVQQLGQVGGVARTTANPLFVAIDFESAGEGVRFGRSPWLTFIEALAREDWARVMLIGLTDDERDSVDVVLEAIGLAPVLIRLNHLGEPELKEYLKALLRSRGLSLEPEVLTARIRDIRSHPMFLTSSQLSLATIEAALAAMAFERLVAQRPAPNG